MEKNDIQDGINRRFFKVIDEFLLCERISSLSDFCKEAGINKTRYTELRRVYGTTPEIQVGRYKSVEIEAIVYLVQNYGISLEWLVLGNGKMYRYK